LVLDGGDTSTSSPVNLSGIRDLSFGSSVALEYLRLFVSGSLERLVVSQECLVFMFVPSGEFVVSGGVGFSGVEADAFIEMINHPDSGETHTAAHNKFSTWHEHEYEALLTHYKPFQAPADEEP
jgi:hypothetical protein